MGEIHKKVLSLLYTENEDSFEMTSQHTGVYVSKTTLVLTCVVGFLWNLFIPGDSLWNTNIEVFTHFLCLGSHIFMFALLMLVFLFTITVDIAILVRWRHVHFALENCKWDNILHASFHDWLLHLSGYFDNLLIVAISLHAKLLGNPRHFLHNLLLHQVHAHGQQGHPWIRTEWTKLSNLPIFIALLTKNAIGHSKAHFHQSNGILTESQECLLWVQVAKSICGY